MPIRRMFLALGMAFLLLPFVGVNQVSAASAAECASIGKCESAGACWSSAVGQDGCTYSCINGSWGNPSCGSAQQQQSNAAAAAANKAEYDRRVAEQQAAAAKAAADAAAKAAAEAAAAEAAARKAAAEQALKDMGQALPTYSGGETYDPATGQQTASSGTSGLTGLNDDEQKLIGSACTSIGKTSAFCGGWESLFRCIPITVDGQCNMRCGLSVDSACAAAAGQSELAGVHQTQLDGAMVVYDASNVDIETCTTNACASTQLTLACTDGNGKIIRTTSDKSLHICVDRESYRQAELSGGTAVKTSGDQTLDLSSLYYYDGVNQTLGDSAFEAPTDAQKEQCMVAAANIGIKEPDSFCSRSFVGGTGVFASGLDEVGQTITGGEGAACSPGTFQTTILSNGALNITQRGGDRSVCGEASGCAAGQQRLCTSAGTLGSCVRTDACAWQVQSAGVAAGASCAGLTRLSYGESGKGQFVGCSEGKNCFCETLSSSSTVQCYVDSGNDSCGAAGTPEITTLTETGGDTPALTVSSPTPTPSTPTGPQCTNITPSNATPQIGDQVSFTCTGSPSDLVTRYEFRYGITTNQSIAESAMLSLASAQGTPDVSVPITVDQVGTYFAQCRPCTANTCLDWEPAELK